MFRFKLPRNTWFKLAGIPMATNVDLYTTASTAKKAYANFRARLADGMPMGAVVFDPSEMVVCQ